MKPTALRRARGSSCELPWPCFGPNLRRTALEKSRSKPKVRKKRLVLSDYYVAQIFRALTTNARGRHCGCSLLHRDEANASQVRSKIWNRTPHQQDFAVQRGDEAGNGHAFQRGNLLENVPKHL